MNPAFRPKKKLNRFTLRELAAVVEALAYRIDGHDTDADPPLKPYQTALAKAKLRKA